MKWGSGPSAAFIKEDQSPWVYGAVVNNIWSFGGPGGTKQLFLNPFVHYNFCRWMVCRFVAGEDYPGALDLLRRPHERMPDNPATRMSSPSR